MKPSRLPCEIVETELLYTITDFHPETGKPFGIRIISRGPYDDDLACKLDEASRRTAKVMQLDNE